jgi:CBS domain-containing protein
MKISELMTKNVTSIGQDEFLSAAAQRMWDCDCGAVPVVNEQGRAVGMITDRDICMATWSKNCAPSALSVRDAMSRELYSCSPNDSLASAESVMRSKQVRRIPVVDDQRRVVGILSLADNARQGEGTGARAAKNELSADRIAATLANICQTSPNGTAPA